MKGEKKEELFKEIMAKSFPHESMDKSMLSKKSSQKLQRINTKRSTLRHIITNLGERRKQSERSSKLARKNKFVIYKNPQ